MDQLFGLQHRRDGDTQRHDQPVGRHHKPATPLGLPCSDEYNGGSRPRLSCDIPTGLIIRHYAFTCTHLLL